MRVGHHQRIGRGWLTGTTIVLPPPRTIGAVDVRGGAPGTRETDLLDPGRLVHHVDAICLTGGSAFGLAAADGVMAWLEEHERGFPIGPAAHEVVPIVPSAVLFDLGRGGAYAHRPDASFGRRAISNAARSGGRGPVALGTVGAGTGARAGGLKGGIGSASVVLDDGSTVAALVALNAVGRAVDGRTGLPLGAPLLLPGDVPGLRRPSRSDVVAAEAAHAAMLVAPLAPAPANTALVVVATDAALTKAEAGRLAVAGHDGLARSIRPIHLMVDGDVCFSLATGARPLPGRPAGGYDDRRAWTIALDRLTAAAADVTARAVVRALTSATDAGEMVSYRTRYPSAFSG
jgi:putative pantetheine hydrolase